MHSIYKYELVLSEHSVGVTMPHKAEILSVQLQYEKVCLWALVNLDEKKVVRHIKMFGTGWPILANEIGVPIGSVICDQFVWHFFDMGEVE